MQFLLQKVLLFGNGSFPFLSLNKDSAKLKIVNTTSAADEPREQVGIVTLALAGSGSAPPPPRPLAAAPQL